MFVSQILLVVLPTNSFSDTATGVRQIDGIRENSWSSLQGSDLLKSAIELAKGNFLVASRRLEDPNFRETVVLLMRYGQDGAAGLVINRPLNVKLSTVLPDFKESEHRNEALHLGGPVEPNKMLLLVSSVKPPQESIQVFGDIYISSSLKELQRLIKSTSKDEKFRIYAGYAGWAPNQLESERDRGDWHVLKADAETLFDKNSTEIWQKMIHRITANWVHLKIPDRSGAQRFSVKRLADKVQFKSLSQKE